MKIQQGSLLDQGSRKLKHTLRSKCIADVQPYLEADGSLGRGNFGFVKNKLHTDIVRKATSNRGPNCVLGSHPPPIHACEAGLPRLTRTTLAQLCSGHCGKLRDFQKRIGKTNDDICADCNLSQKNVGHLFDCPAHPTTLNVRDLWENPRDAVDHLKSFAIFDFLPPLGSPPRRVRRRRPPAAPPDSPVFTPTTLPPSPFFSPPPPLPPLPRIPPLINLSRESSFSSLSSLGSSSSLRDVNSL